MKLSEVKTMVMTILLFKKKETLEALNPQINKGLIKSTICRLKSKR